jgi:hypothetical protein
METQLGLCQPATAILLISVAGTLYHILAGAYPSMVIWWIMVGIFGTGVFQALCFGGLEPVAWVVMMIPVLIVCFFLAVALFASRMRIENIKYVDCNRCGRPKHECHCSEGFQGRANLCPYARCSCPRCGGDGPICPYCPGAPPAVTESFDTHARQSCSECKCIGGSCNGACQPNQCLDCDGSGDPFCTYANTVVNGSEGYDPASPWY